MHLIVCEPWRLIYAPLPKCASTTMINLLMDIGGMPSQRGPRDCPRKSTSNIGRGTGGVYELRVEREEIPTVARRLEAYTWFSVIRDPFARVESNYHNKLNRYARRFHPLAYLCGYATPVRPGTSVEAWQAARIRTIQTFIPFERFIHGLERHGIDWDPHFAPQVKVLALDQVRFDRLIHMEQLAEGLESLFRGIGRLTAARPALASLRRYNASCSADSRSRWTPHLRDIVADLYHEDFAGLASSRGFSGRRAA